jgi:hypothetical protein
MLKKLLLITLFSGSWAFAQKPAEIAIISDNDLYTSTVNDQYYTNGIEFIYRYLGTSKRESVAKKITEFRLSQYMYNPQSPQAGDIDINDRPFAGYLFAQAGINTFYKNESVLKLYVQAGVVGPESGAEIVQKALHKVAHYKPVDGWQYQITTTPAAQIGAFYSHKVFGGTFHEKIDFHLQGEAMAGTIWNSATIGALSRISLKGALKNISSSAMYNATLEADRDTYKGRRELFLFLNPKLQYMAFDATIQGSPFNDKSPVTFPLIPFRFNAEAGIKYGHNKWNYGFSFNYRGKELKNIVITGYYYGSIQLGYLF